MNDYRNSIFATILYYDAFNFPLTFAEVYRYLINPKRLTSNYAVAQNEVNVETAEILIEMDNMARVGLIGHKNGFYFLPGRDDLYEQRIEKDKLANKKWKKFLATAKYLQFAPYLRAVFASGSLAANNPEPRSDFDVFIIVKSGRLYTGRLFLWLISSALGARRGRFDVVAPDKLCFNHYLTEDNLELSHRGLYIAQSLANMKPVIVSDRVLGKFIASNRWASSYCYNRERGVNSNPACYSSERTNYTKYNFRPATAYRGVKISKALLVFARTGEIFLNNFLGDLLEKILKAFQQKRIKNNPATYESGGRIIFTDSELEFHPRSFERVVIDNYNQGLKKFGVSGVAEADSGLLDL